MDKGECPRHDPAPVGRQSVPSPSLQPRPPRLAPKAMPPGLAERDVRRLAWWLFEQVATAKEMDATKARVLATVLNLLESLGPGGMEGDAKLTETVRIGKLSLGMPPEGDDEWEWVLERFKDEAVDEFRRWPPLAEEAGVSG